MPYQRDLGRVGALIDQDVDCPLSAAIRAGAFDDALFFWVLADMAERGPGARLRNRHRWSPHPPPTWSRKKGARDRTG